MRSSRFVLTLLLAVGAAHGEDGKEADAALITAADIAREKPANIVEMLKSRVGLDENNSVITMRGVRGIAISVDGFASSMAELQALKPEQVERIEILRGAASARFGAEAMGGAIAVVTRGAHQGMHASFAQGFDSRRGRFTRVSGGHEADGLGWSLLAEDTTHHGFLTVPDSPFPYQITVADERSKTRLIDGRLGWRGGDLDLSLHLKRADEWAFLGRPNWMFDWRTENARAQIAWRASAALTLEALLGEERYESMGVRDRGSGADPVGLAPEQRLAQSNLQREGTLSMVWRDGSWSGRAGTTIGTLDESFGSRDYATHQATTTADSSIRKEALFVSAELPVRAGRLELDLRRDWQHYLSSRVFDVGPPVQETRGGNAIKSATSPKMALSWPLGGDLRLRGSVGTGFSPPQASQLYNGYTGAGSVTLANPGLKPELSTTGDLRLSHADATGNWELTLFATRWRDKIATRIVDYGTPLVQQPQNVGEVQARGVEINWTQRIARQWSASANYTYSRTRIVANAADPTVVGNELPDMPRHKANLSLAWEPGGNFTARAKLRAVGSTFTDDANTVVDARGYRWKKSDFGVLDLTAAWSKPGWELTLALNNVLGRDYVQGFFWHGEPRTLRGELVFHY